MDALFEDAPLFVANTEYAKMKDREAAERELREGNDRIVYPWIRCPNCSLGTFVPGGLTGGVARDDIEEGIDDKRF